MPKSKLEDETLIFESSFHSRASRVDIVLDHLWDRSYVTRVPSQKRSSTTTPYLRGSHYRQILFLPRLPDSFFTFHLINHTLILILSTFPHCTIRVSRRITKSPRHHAIKPSSPQAIVSEYDMHTDLT